MDALEPHPGMAAEELARLRDELLASIDRSQEMLRKTELLLVAAQLSRSTRHFLLERDGDAPSPGESRLN